MLMRCFAPKVLRLKCRTLTKQLTTWSALATSFNSRPSNKISFGARSGLFGHEELKESNGFHLMKENAVIECNNLIEECLSPNRSRKMVEVFDNLSNTLCRVADLAEFVRVGHPDPKFSKAAENASVSISQLVEKLNTNRQLYDSLKTVVERKDITETTEVDDHVAKLFLIDFESSGIHLGEEKRSQVVYLNDLILYLGQQYAYNSMKPTAIAKENVPPVVRTYFPSDDGKILVTGLFSDFSLEAAREAAYKIYLHPDKRQEDLLMQLLTARNDLAKVCGFPTFAHRALQGSLAEHPTMVAHFLEKLNDKLAVRAERDFYQMTRLKGSVVQPWDPPYLTAEAKKKYLSFTKTDLMPYLSLGACMEGLNNLTERLFSINLIPQELEPGEAWCSSIYKIAVIHETEGKLGDIYCDFFERSGKPHQDCHFTIQGGKMLDDGTYQNPIVVLMLNFPMPSGSIPPLLNPAMVDNLFHEMGHALHSMMARTRYQHVTGTRCTTDFAEVPSILMEYFSNDPRVLATFAKHYQTGEVMPKELREKYALAKYVFSASEMQLQNFYAALDQTLHTEKYPLEKSTIEILEKVHSKFYGLPYVHNTAWHLRFGHLVGYGAKYYSYLMSRAVASWIWREYFRDDPFDSTKGEKYRREVLAHGGGIPAHILVSKFLGRAITPGSLTEALIADIDSNQTKLDKYKGQSSSFIN